jgi:hypothetical protein
MESNDKSDELVNKAKNIIKNPDDDEAVLELEKMNLSNDKVIDTFENSGLIDQKVQAVSYTVDGLYSDKKMRKFKTRAALKSNPPTLTIESNSGDQAKFFLTKELTNNLYTMLKDVRNAYVGIKKTHQHTDTIPGAHRGLGVLLAYIRLHAREVLIALVWAMAGLSYSRNFVLGSVLASFFGIILIFVPEITKKFSTKKGDDNL